MSINRDSQIGVPCTPVSPRPAGKNGCFHSGSRASLLYQYDSRTRVSCRPLSRRAASIVRCALRATHPTWRSQGWAMTRSFEDELSDAAGNIEQKRFAAAEEQLQRCLMQRPDSLQAMYLMSGLLGSTGRIDE